MNIVSILSTAFLNLWRRKLRTALTVLGMVIGTASIVVMISLGIGSNKARMETLAQMGSLTRLEIYPGQYAESSSGMMQRIENKLDDRTIAQFRELRGVAAATPLLEGSAYLKVGKYMNFLQLCGIDMGMAELFEIRLGEGAYPKKEGSWQSPEILLSPYAESGFMDQNYRPAMDKQGNSLVELYSPNMRLTFDYNNIYENPYADLANPEDQPKKGKLYRVNFTGVQQESNDAYRSYIDINAMLRLQQENKDWIYYNTRSGYQLAWVKVEGLDDVERVTNEIKQMGFSVYSLGEEAKATQKETERQQALFGAVGGVALLVAVIGITNTMMMSIYERTREIGVIKVLGCRMRNILEMFISEAAFIGFIGGLTGIGLSFGLTSALNTSLFAELGLVSEIPVYLALAGIAFSTLLAVMGGLYPSIRAMQLSPLAAIRNE